MVNASQKTSPATVCSSLRRYGGGLDPGLRIHSCFGQTVFATAHLVCDLRTPRVHRRSSTPSAFDAHARIEGPFTKFSKHAFTASAVRDFDLSMEIAHRILVATSGRAHAEEHPPIKRIVGHDQNHPPGRNELERRKDEIQSLYFLHPLALRRQ